jgi:hypothetical protein
MISDVADYRFYGMNVRFFYDATQLDFLHFNGFHEGIIAENPNPARVTEGDQWGSHMFNFSSSAAAVNGAVKIADPNASIEFSTEQWTKFFEVCFEVRESVPVDQDFCPSVIWDMKTDESIKGSFLPGSQGVVITAFGNSTSAKQKMIQTSAIHYNWDANEHQASLPFGFPLNHDCIELSSQVTGVSNHGTPKVFDLLQNQPNPFNESTTIQFILPEASRAKLTFFDAGGKSVRQIVGDYAEGTTTLTLQKKDFVDVSNVLFYQLETPTRKSVFRKMLLFK